MSSPFNFGQLDQRTKIIVVAGFIFTISLSVGMLVFGSNDIALDSMTVNSLHVGKDAIHYTPH
jgi:hypothetical protein